MTCFVCARAVICASGVADEVNEVVNTERVRGRSSYGYGVRLCLTKVMTIISRKVFRFARVFYLFLTIKQTWPSPSSGLI